jgi:hypothetical protein
MPWHRRESNSSSQPLLVLNNGLPATLWFLRKFAGLAIDRVPPATDWVAANSHCAAKSAFPYSIMNRSELLGRRFKKRTCSFRFGLRALLLFTTLICVLLGLWLRPRAYDVEALLYFRPGVPLHQFDGQEYEEMIRSHLAFVESDTVLLSAIRDPAVATVSVLQKQSDPVAWLRQYLEVASPEMEVLSIRMQCTQYGLSTYTRIVEAVADAYQCEVARAANRREEIDAKQLRLLRDKILEKQLLINQMASNADQQSTKAIAAKVKDLQRTLRKAVLWVRSPQPRVRQVRVTVAPRN